MSALTFLLWLALVMGAGWTAFPLARRAFGAQLSGADLPDAGLAVGRILFLASWTMLAFQLGQLGVSTATSAWLYLPLALIGIAVGWRDRAAIKQTWRRNKRALIATEAIFVAVFLSFFLLRGFWSDTNGNNGEKGMDSALIGTLIRAEKLPPPNPYGAGARLSSYYYFGPLQTALLTRASGTHLRWSYNLMCATLPALCCAALFSLGSALTGSNRGGVWVTGAVLAGGTLQPLYQWAMRDPNMANRPLALDAFAVSRVIPYTISEYPFFTFNQADLHGHYFDFPLQIALMSLGWCLLRAKRVITASLAALVLGAMIVTNTWDFPAFALLMGMSVVVSKGGAMFTPFSKKIVGRDGAHSATESSTSKTTASKTAKGKSSARGKKARARLSNANSTNQTAAREVTAIITHESANAGGVAASETPRTKWIRLGLRTALALGAMAVALLLAAPFLLRLQSAANPPQWLQQPASPLREWLLLWGPIALGWWVFSAYSTFKENIVWRATIAIMVVGVGIAAIFTQWGAPSILSGPLFVTNVGLVWPLIAASAGFAIAGAFHLRGAERYLCLLALCGLVALGWSEATWAGFLGNADHIGFDDNKRQDTVFKFGLQVWMLWGTASAAGVWIVVSRGSRLLKECARIVIVPLALVMMAGNLAFALYRVRFADMVYARAARQPNWFKFDAWDGWAHLAPPEKAAANWLRRNVKAGENIVEAEQRQGGDFTEYARYTTVTGIPTIIGPLAHSFYWAPSGAPMGRGQAGRDAKLAAEWDEVFRRKADVQRIYSPMENGDRVQMLRAYGVKYLIWGELERREYGESTLADLSSLPIAAQFGAPDGPRRVIIFRVD